MPNHEQVTLTDDVNVDVGMAKLLSAMWELGVRTSYSCQGSPEKFEEILDGAESYILFPRAVDALDFFSKTLGALREADRLAQIVVEVRHIDLDPAKRGPAVTLEVAANPMNIENELRGVVRFDPELLPRIEAVFGS